MLTLLPWVQTPSTTQQSPIQPDLEHCHGLGIHSFSRQRTSVLHHPLVANFFLTSNLYIFSFIFKPLLLFLSLHAPPVCTSPRYWKAAMSSPQNLLFSEQPQLFLPVFIGEMRQPSHHLCGPLDSLYRSFLRWGPQNGGCGVQSLKLGGNINFVQWSWFVNLRFFLILRFFNQCVDECGGFQC